MDWPFRALNTPRLKLRSLKGSDAGGYLKLFSDPETLAYWSTEPIRSLADAPEMVEKDIQWVESGEALCWGIALADTDELIGKISLYFSSGRNQRAEGTAGGGCGCN